MSRRIPNSFFQRDALEVAPNLIGKKLCVNADGTLQKYTISEIEVYRGEEDLACHASKGRTKRTEIMYSMGGYIYVYLIYGMYWMLNFVCAAQNTPQAILIRGIEGFAGPGKLTRHLKIDGTFYGENLEMSHRIWLEENSKVAQYTTTPRIGIAYAGEPWVSINWRYVMNS